MEDYEDIKVLIVDDDNQFLAKKMFQMIGYPNYAQAYGGQQALDYIYNNDVDIVFLDRMMPYVSGIDVFKKLKEDKKIEAMEVIFQTGKTLPDELTEILESGAEYLLPKPYYEDDLALFANRLSEDIRRKRLFKTKLSQVVKNPNLINFSVITPSDAIDASVAIAVQCHGGVEVAEGLYSLMINGIEHDLINFSVITPSDAIDASVAIAVQCHGGVEVAEGLYSLMINGIEHGNLNMLHGYEDKTSFMRVENYSGKILQAESSRQSVEVNFSIQDDKRIVSIKDQGCGFANANKPPFIISVENIMQPYGKGLIKAHKIFKDILYSQGGSMVTCFI